MHGHFQNQVGTKHSLYLMDVSDLHLFLLWKVSTPGAASSVGSKMMI